MIIIRSIIFTIALAFGFILSANLDGIEKIREGASDMASSIISAFQNRESSSIDEIDNSLSTVSKYASPTTAKYLLIVAFVIYGFFSATLIGAGVAGLLGGVLFSPEIASIPILSDAAVSISSTVSALWADLMAKLAQQ